MGGMAAKYATGFFISVAWFSLLFVLFSIPCNHSAVEITHVCDWMSPRLSVYACVGGGDDLEILYC